MKIPGQNKIERWNVATHFPGTIFASLGSIALWQISAPLGGRVQWAVLLFGASMFLVFLTSCLYHAYNHTPRAGLFKRMDHIAIYFLIAGSYTPFVVLFQWDDSGFLLLKALWFMLVLGIFFKIFFVYRFKIFSTTIYLLMGWSVVFMGRPILANVPADCLNYLILGGFFYTTGVIFYLWKGWAYNHTVWHVFVLAGAVAHFRAVWVCLT